MKKQITFGLIASALALSTAAFAPAEGQANNRDRQLPQLAMQMYMNTQAIAAQQQYYNYNNQYYYNNANSNPYYGRTIYGNGYYRNGNWDNRWNSNDFNNRLRFNSSTIGRILNRVF